MNRKLRILVVEDEEAIRNGLLDVLVYHGYDVDFAEEGLDGLKKARSGQYDLILLDVMLPGMDGFEICNKVREQDKEQPIIMLTAKTSDDDIIHGLSLGADDYVSKPFSIAQLVLRIQAVLRRSKVAAEQENQIQLDQDTYIDTRNLTGKRRDQDLSFTRREIEILQYLNSHADRPVPREELLTKIWGYAKDLDIETRTVDIHIAKLRRKIEHESSRPSFLVTVRGAGYKLVSQ
jgi:two-component system alkaline phosphatase synthesis response regulator PhoP